MEYQKFVYHYENNSKLMAGGIIFYDDNGIWLIKEHCKDKFYFSDLGGKYTVEDCNIFATIYREFMEVTYYSFPLTYMDIVNFVTLDKCRKIFVCNDREKSPTYLCILFDTKDISFKLDRELFLTNREKTLRENSKVPINFYSSFDLVYLTNDDVKKEFRFFNYRLKQIIRKRFENTKDEFY